MQIRRYFLGSNCKSDSVGRSTKQNQGCRRMGAINNAQIMPRSLDKNMELETCGPFHYIRAMYKTTLFMLNVLYKTGTVRSWNLDFHCPEAWSRSM